MPHGGNNGALQTILRIRFYGKFSTFRGRDLGQLDWNRVAPLYAIQDNSTAMRTHFSTRDDGDGEALLDSIGDYETAIAMHFTRSKDKVSVLRDGMRMTWAIP